MYLLHAGIHATSWTGRTEAIPLIQESTPKLELQAALMGARLCMFTTDEMSMKLHSTQFWTDSITVLSWVASLGNLKSYCANIFGEIFILCKAEQLKHISGKLFPASKISKRKGTYCAHDDRERSLPLQASRH